MNYFTTEDSQKIHTEQMRLSEIQNKELQDNPHSHGYGPLIRVGIKASIRRSIEDLELVAKSIKNIDRVSFNIVSNQIEQLSKMLNKY